MMFLFGVLFVCLASFAHASEAQKLEGSCHGKLADNTLISFSYYSDYDGCHPNIAGTIKFSSASGLGRHRGSRAFSDQKDIYSFRGYRLTFLDSTGNVSGDLEYIDKHGLRQSVSVDCQVNDFEYVECSLPL